MDDKKHRCPDWDFALIKDDGPEIESCQCDINGMREWMYQCKFEWKSDALDL